MTISFHTALRIKPLLGNEQSNDEVILTRKPLENEGSNEMEIALLKKPSSTPGNNNNNNSSSNSSVAAIRAKFQQHIEASRPNSASSSVKELKFDLVLDSNCDEEEVHEFVGRSVVDNVLANVASSNDPSMSPPQFHCELLISMDDSLNHTSLWGNTCNIRSKFQESDGLLPRIVDDLFSQLQTVTGDDGQSSISSSANSSTFVEINMVEVCNDDQVVLDLLSITSNNEDKPEAASSSISSSASQIHQRNKKVLTIHQDPDNGQYYLPEMKTIACSNAKEARRTLARGLKLSNKNDGNSNNTNRIITIRPCAGDACIGQIIVVDSSRTCADSYTAAAVLKCLRYTKENQNNNNSVPPSQDSKVAMILQPTLTELDSDSCCCTVLATAYQGIKDYTAKLKLLKDVQSLSDQYDMMGQVHLSDTHQTSTPLARSGHSSKHHLPKWAKKSPLRHIPISNLQDTIKSKLQPVSNKKNKNNRSDAESKENKNNSITLHEQEMEKLRKKNRRLQEAYDELHQEYAEVKRKVRDLTKHEENYLKEIQELKRIKNSNTRNEEEMEEERRIRHRKQCLFQNGLREHIQKVTLTHEMKNDILGRVPKNSYSLNVPPAWTDRKL